MTFWFSEFLRDAVPRSANLRLAPFGFRRRFAFFAFFAFRGLAFLGFYNLAVSVGNHFLNRGAKFGEPERFRQADLVLLFEKLAGLFRDGIAGDEDGAFGERGIDRAQLFVNLLAVQARHFPVAQHHVVFFLFGLSQPGLAIRAKVHFVTPWDERFADHVQDRFFIVDHEDAFALAFAFVDAVRRIEMRFLGGVSGFVSDREFDNEHAAFAGLAARRDRAAVLLDNSITEAES